MFKISGLAGIHVLELVHLDPAWTQQQALGRCNEGVARSVGMRVFPDDCPSEMRMESMDSIAAK